MSESVNLSIEISCADVKALGDSGASFVLYDCREADEHAHCSISGSLLIPMSELRDRLSELEPHRDARVVVHCHHGGRSLRVAAFLRQQGFAQAQSMSGGIDEWSATIDPSVPRY
jgi:rhodanese-related sulfurtransferase